MLTFWKQLCSDALIFILVFWASFIVLYGTHDPMRYFELSDILYLYSFGESWEVERKKRENKRETATHGQSFTFTIRAIPQQFPNGNRQVVNAAENVIPAGTMFKEDVRSALPYIETMTQTRYAYEGVLKDEGRNFGLEVRSLL